MLCSLYLSYPHFIHYPCYLCIHFFVCVCVLSFHLYMFMLTTYFLYHIFFHQNTCFIHNVFNVDFIFFWYMYIIAVIVRFYSFHFMTIQFAFLYKSYLINYQWTIFSVTACFSMLMPTFMCTLDTNCSIHICLRMISTCLCHFFIMHLFTKPSLMTTYFYKLMNSITYIMLQILSLLSYGYHVYWCNQTTISEIPEVQLHDSVYWYSNYIYCIMCILYFQRHHFEHISSLLPPPSPLLPMDLT